MRTRSQRRLRRPPRRPRSLAEANNETEEAADFSIPRKGQGTLPRYSAARGRKDERRPLLLRSASTTAAAPAEAVAGSLNGGGGLRPKEGRAAKWNEAPPAFTLSLPEAAEAPQVSLARPHVCLV